MRIRRQLRPGDVGAMIALHGRLYSEEWGHDATFEAMVAESFIRPMERGWPRPNEGIWLVEDGDRLVGCLGLTDEGHGEARLRWFVFEPHLRGRGLGRQLLAELFDKAEEAGYERITLETFSDLAAAAHLYREHGFELVWEDTRPRWSRLAVTYQRYERLLRSAVVSTPAA
jgi:ribosomal protein S18 acetylase RimI-like enzyme